MVPALAQVLGDCNPIAGRWRINRALILGRLRRLGCLAHSVDDIADDLVHEALVVAFRHHADDRLGAGWADHEAAACAQPGLGRDRWPS